MVEYEIMIILTPVYMGQLSLKGIYGKVWKRQKIDLKCKFNLIYINVRKKLCELKNGNGFVKDIYQYTCVPNRTLLTFVIAEKE